MTDGKDQQSQDVNEPLFLGGKKRRRSSCEKQFLGDYLIGNPAVVKAMSKFGDKGIIFSDNVVKVNKRTKMQERILLITETSIYNINRTSRVKRRINIKDLGAIVISPYEDNFFLLRVPVQYDYLLVSSRKTEIIVRLLTAYQTLTGESLPVAFETKFEYNAELGSVKEVEFSLSNDGITTTITNKTRRSKSNTISGKTD